MSAETVPFRVRLRELALQLTLLADGRDGIAHWERARPSTAGEEFKDEWWLGQARQIYAARRLREKYFPASFFGEPAWTS